MSGEGGEPGDWSVEFSVFSVASFSCNTPREAAASVSNGTGSDLEEEGSGAHTT